MSQGLAFSFFYIVEKTAREISLIATMGADAPIPPMKRGAAAPEGAPRRPQLLVFKKTNKVLECTHPLIETGRESFSTTFGTPRLENCQPVAAVRKGGGTGGKSAHHYETKNCNP